MEDLFERISFSIKTIVHQIGTCLPLNRIISILFVYCMTNTLFSCIIGAFDATARSKVFPRSKIDSGQSVLKSYEIFKDMLRYSKEPMLRLSGDVSGLRFLTFVLGTGGFTITYKIPNNRFFRNFYFPIPSLYYMPAKGIRRAYTTTAIRNRSG